MAKSKKASRARKPVRDLKARSAKAGSVRGGDIGINRLMHVAELKRQQANEG
jgi:hypothetical protein